MALPTCFWALLSIPDLIILHVSATIGTMEPLKHAGITIDSLLLGQCVFDLVHPDEYAIAKQDLSIFLRRRMLAGAITRCRLRSVGSMAKILHPALSDTIAATWDIVDVVTYVVTEDTVLAFFHYQQNKKITSTTCGEQAFTTKDMGLLHERVSARRRPPSSQRVFQIYASKTQTRLFSWPPSSMTMASFRDAEPYQYNNVSLSSCMRQTQARAKLPTCNVESILVSYGQLLFYSFEINPNSTMTPSDSSSTQMPLSMPLSIPPPMSLPMEAHHYFQMRQKQCTRCGAVDSPEWRRGPSGHKTLCNACGLRYFRSKKRQ
ncbi:hypothetical protein BC940DRAFT_307591 [Gongronella butleri]|nr:hypothetical protein BC940DRAFT_307591 [Gongronella butleri]